MSVLVSVYVPYKKKKDIYDDDDDDHHHHSAIAFISKH